MSLFSRGGGQRRAAGEAVAELIPRRESGRRGAVSVTGDSALRHSAVWAACRLRYNLMSAFPVGVYRKVGDVQIEVSKPPILVEPGGKQWDYLHWMKASQFDLDRAGNTIGLITEKNSLGLPSRIDLQPIHKCQVIRRAVTNRLEYRIDGKLYQPEQVWHERANAVAGLDVGLSQIAYAAWSIGEYLSIQDFALDWFAGGGVPKARLKNTAKKLDMKEAGILKDRWKATVQNGDLFVHGNDWEYSMMQGMQVGMEWIEGRRFGLGDIARFFDVPADLIDAAISAPGSITYQSALQRNLQFLIMHLQPAVTLRENNLSKTQPTPRFVKLNTNALLRMDPETQAKVIHQRIVDRTLTPNEGRAFYDLPPLTPEQVAEFDILFGAPRTNPTAAVTPPAAGNAGAHELAAEPPVRAIATVGKPLTWEEPS